MARNHPAIAGGHQDQLSDLGWQALARAKNLPGAVRQRESATERGPIAEHQIRFEDGGAYERNMGTWSRLAGEPAEVNGIDPSAEHLAFARARSGARMAAFRHGDAIALPCGDRSFPEHRPDLIETSD